MRGGAAAAAEEGYSKPTAILEVRLSVPPTLPDRVRTTLANEVTAIWQRQAVSIKWTTGAADAQESGRPFRLLVVPGRGTGASLDEKAATVGELLRSPDGHPVAFASLDVAERIVREAQGSGPSPPDALSYYRLGLVLGRAAAHEIGHFLLDTHTHARRGLMRARFEPVEFVDTRSGTFVLDQDAGAWLEGRLRQGIPLGRTHVSLAESATLDDFDARESFAYGR